MQAALEQAQAGEKKNTVDEGGRYFGFEVLLGILE
jgi:hypothetical protein